MAIQRGELYFLELGPTRGRELNDKRRPVLVLSVNDINRHPLVVTVVPGTTRDPNKKVHWQEVRIDPRPQNGLTNPTVFQCFQMKALDHSRFDKPPIGVVSPAELQSIEETVKRCLGLM